MKICSTLLISKDMQIKQQQETSFNSDRGKLKWWGSILRRLWRGKQCKSWNKGLWTGSFWGGKKPKWQNSSNFKGTAIDWMSASCQNSCYILNSQCDSIRRWLGIKDWCWGWNSNTLATSCEELTHWKRPWWWEGLGAGGEGDDRGWDGWMASPTRCTWVWVNPGSWWRTGRPGVLRYMGSQRIRQDWPTEMNWTELRRY